MIHNLKWRCLLASLHDEIRATKAKGLDDLIEVEICFQVSVGYWAELKKRVEREDFPNLAAEIYFFKKIKPKFTSEIEYYKLLYYGHVFEPHEDRQLLKIFWSREAERQTKFQQDHEEFYNYYKHGHRLRDTKYFTRSSRDDFGVLDNNIYDKEKGYQVLLITLLHK